MATDRVIRQARPGDASELLAIYAPIVRETAISYELAPPTEAEFAARIERITADGPWLVSDRGGTIEGYAYASEFRSRGAYATTKETTVYVHPDHHRAGVGRELMISLLDEITDRGARTAIAVIGLPNDGSIALHEALGFRYVGTLHEIARKFDAWHDEGFWELPLPRPDR
ncbi:MAG: GNAT family N-acetyltransferase [Acidimicrobiales bacterium]